MCRESKTGFSVSPGFLFVIAAAGVIEPVVLAATLCAALMHEGGHIGMLYLVGGRLRAVRLTAFGAAITVREEYRLSYGRELLVVLAGPLVNLLTAPVFACFASREAFCCILAGAGIITALFNLLPILPLDGGRILHLCISYFFGPMVADAVAAVVGTVVAMLLTAVGLLLVRNGGCFLLAAALGLLFGILPQLRLAKNAVRV